MMHKVRILLIVGLAAAAPPALATMPGANGRIAYVDTLDPGTIQARPAIFVSDSGPLTHPRAIVPGAFGSDHDTWPAWSPDGQEVAFLRADGEKSDHLLKIIGRDGSGERQVLSTDFFDQTFGNGHEIAFFHEGLTWSPDGQKLAFALNHRGRHENTGIWIVGADGTGVSQLVRHRHAGSEESAQFPDWSPLGNEVLYVCWFRGEGEQAIGDICTVNIATRVVRQLPITLPAPPGGSVFGFQRVSRPKWTPDGKKIMFSATYVELKNQVNLPRNEIFSINADGSGIVRLSDSPLMTCGTGTLPRPSVAYHNPAPSPDGTLIAAWAVRNDCGVTIPWAEPGIWTLSASGGQGTRLIPSVVNSHDWQPLPADLTVHINDGHGNALRGLKVELRTPQGEVLDHQPLNPAGGSYAFENIAPGRYVMRATLIDHAGGPDAVPSFDIRHSLTPEEPVWIERSVTIDPDVESVLVTLPFENSPILSDDNQEPSALDQLDDMANIYFRVRQFVDWVKLNLTPDTGLTVPFYTFATADPVDDAFPVAPQDAYYVGLPSPRIVFGTAESEFENRDGVQDPGHEDNAPENGEWHEFTHHLHETHLSPCLFGIPHAGYANPDTCESMSEGFAEFLPAFAARSIDGVSDAEYDNMINLENNIKAWGRSGLSRSLLAEELAVAGLFWDITDVDRDLQDSQVIGANGAHRDVTYTDQTAMTLQQLWAQLTSTQPATVFELRTSFGAPAITVDLDGDAVADVAPLDQVFLMHGFFPVNEDQTIGLAHLTYHYDVAAAQRAEPTAPRNGAVGRSDHVIYDASGEVTDSFIPREKTPVDPKANFEINVQDASGTPLWGARLDLLVQYPGMPQTTSTRRLASGDAALVHLELPAYFDYLLPVDAPLPPCDPVHDVRVDVTITAHLNGHVSADMPHFDNCEYLQAIANAPGPAAMAFTVTFPEDSTAPVTTLDATASPPAVGGNTIGAWTVSLSCADPVENGFASGCSRSEYRLDGGATSVYRGPVVVDEIGQHTFEYRSVDAAANAEDFRSVDLGVIADPDRPTDTPTVVPPPTPTLTPPHTPPASPTLTTTSTHSPANTPTLTPTGTATQPPTATPSSPPPTPTVCADVDGDGHVTWRDMLIEAVAVLFGSRDPRHDINRDGRVNLADLRLVVGQLGRSCRT